MKKLLLVGVSITFFAVPCSANDWIRTEGTPGTPSGGILTVMPNSASPNPWRLVIQYVSGKIGVVGRYETEAQCKEALENAQGIPTTSEEKAYAQYFNSRSGGINVSRYVVISTDIANAACLDW